jgi:hypothetical protein
MFNTTFKRITGCPLTTIPITKKNPLCRITSMFIAVFTKANQLRPLSNCTPTVSVRLHLILLSHLRWVYHVVSSFDVSVRTFFCISTFCVPTKDAWYAHWSRLQHVTSSDQPTCLRQSRVVTTQVMLRSTDCIAFSWYQQMHDCLLLHFASSGCYMFRLFATFRDLTAK